MKIERAIVGATAVAAVAAGVAATEAVEDTPVALARDMASVGDNVARVCHKLFT